MLQCFHCFAAKVATLWNGTNWSRSHAKIRDSVANSYGPDPVLMLAMARNERSPMVKNSASSPPGAGSVDQGSKRPPDSLSSSSSVSLSPPFMPGGPPGMSLASCGIASSSRPATVKTSTARAPEVGIRCISVSAARMASLQQLPETETSNLELLSATYSVNGCDACSMSANSLCCEL